MSNTLKSPMCDVSNTHYNIAGYYRLSKDDGKDIESNSIKNQREIVKAYIAKREDFKGAKIIDYADDGISGSHSEREAYKQLLADIENGCINCIVVKDLSRIGRNLIDVDDLLMNYLVTLKIRFVAINNGYDSFSNPLSNLELALINLANQHYNRDLVEKSMSIKHSKARRGEYLAIAPFGYKKSKIERNKLVPDDEAARYVQLIFSLAVEGHRPVEIAQILNAQGIPSPSVYKTRKGWSKTSARRIDHDYCFWRNDAVYRLLKNEVYIGNAISNKYKVTNPGTGCTVPRPKSEWIIVPNAHKPLVSESDFNKVQLLLPRQKNNRNTDHIFGNKVKCPVCGYAMKRYTKQNPRFKCGTAKLTNHYGCKEYSILQSDIEDVVLAYIRVQADVLLDREETKLYQHQKNTFIIKELEKKIAAENKTIELLESSITKIFIDFSSNKITKEIFQQKKDTINETTARKRSEVKKWSEQIKKLSNERIVTEKAIDELKPLLTLETLDKNVVDLLIDKIFVHNEKDIEIVWKGIFLD